MTDPDTNGIPNAGEPTPLVVQVERMTAALAAMRAERDHWREARRTAIEGGEMLKRERDALKVRWTPKRANGSGSSWDLEKARGLLTRIRGCVTETGGVYYSSKYLGTDGLIGVWVRDADAFLAHR